MADTEIQFLVNEDGEQTAAVVPIEIWREISSERETAYLLSSPAMKERLLAAINSTNDIPFDEAMAKLGL